MKNFRPLPSFLTIAPSNIEGLGLFTRKKYKKYINSDTGLFAIRGPWHTNEHGHSTQFYSHKENE